jgi:hypothetical protein
MTILLLTLVNADAITCFTVELIRLSQGGSVQAGFTVELIRLSQGGSVQAGFTVELIRLLVMIFYYKAEAQKMERISLQHVQDLIHQIEEVYDHRESLITLTLINKE